MMLCPGQHRCGRRRSTNFQLLAPWLSLWLALSYASRLIVGSPTDFAASGDTIKIGDEHEHSRPAKPLELALFCCAGCAIASAALVAWHQQYRSTDRLWRRAAKALDALATGAEDGERCRGSRRRDGDTSCYSRLLLSPLLRLLLLSFWHAVATLCELVTMATLGAGDSCSAAVGFEPLVVATLTAAIADVVGADALQAGLVGEPLTSAAILGLPLAAYGAADLLAGHPRSSLWRLSDDGVGGGCADLALVSVAIISRLARNFGLKAAYSHLETAAASASGGDSKAVSAAAAAAARSSLFSAMNAAACLWLLPVAVALGVADEEQRRLTGLGPVADVAATLVYGFCSTLSLLAILPALTLVEHAIACLAKNAMVAAAFAAVMVGDGLGSQQAAACTVVVVGVMFTVSEDACEVGNVAQPSRRRLRTLRCIVAAVCYAALLWTRSGVSDHATTPAAPSSVKSVGCYSDPLLREGEAAAAISASHLPLSGPWREAGFGSLPPPSPPPPLPNILADEPLSVAGPSNTLRSVDDLVAESRRLLDSLLGHLFAGRRRAVLVNLFSWPNKGDHLITVAELRTLERHNVSVVHACMFPAVNCSFAQVPRGPDLVVLLQGGGYSGHPSHQGAFDSAIRSFPDQRIVLLPNSLCYPAAPCSAAALAAFARSLLNHSDFHVLLRDAYSYETARRAVDDLVDDYRARSGLRLYLAPDVAWATESLVVNVAPVYDIVWLKRKDWESMDKDPMPPLPAGLRVQVLDWVDSWMGQKENNYWEHLQLRTLSGVAFLSRGRVVVSDRLHAHIMSQLMRKPNVLINSKTQKQGHYYTTWERSVETSRLASNNSEALVLALELLLRHGGSVSVPSINPFGKI